MKRTPGATSLRLDEETQKLLKTLADELGLGRASVVRLALKLLDKTAKEAGKAGAETLRRLANPGKGEPNV